MPPHPPSPPPLPSLAVLGGQLLADKVGVSEKVLGNVGGILFLLFAAATAADVVAGSH